ncbi:MAG: hypothetical protein GQ540_07850 [Lutibacter sp.]|uniref:hypothetical protein n=1 Tax=Lutibacter sp. TaxID=1925666 RepID=UPI0019D8027F|nr:hypothetical protein [Lutibacter sp.]NOR28425.1 hypothetical protein [Lutibacter sp.]
MRNSIIRISTVLLLSIPFLSCEADDPATPAPNVCDNAQIYSLSTTDPYTGLTDLNSNGADETLAWAATGTIVTGGLGVAINNSSTSTYNFDNENYHYYNYQSKEFININSNATFNNVSLTGDLINWKYNGITYISTLGKYYIIGVNVTGTPSPTGTIGLFEVLNINTGTIATTPTMTISGYSVSSGMEVLFLQLISVATDHNDMVYVISGNDIFSFDLTSGTSLFTTPLPGAIYEYYGLEYNDAIGKLNAIQYSYSGPSLFIIEIDPISLLASSTSVNLNNFIPTFVPDYYSTTLSCDEDTYFISTRSANIDTDFYTVDISFGASMIASAGITNSTITGNYYFGLESNGNN